MFVLVSGLPRSGKSAFADALASEGYTHVPLDRYIRPISDPEAFLEWVSSPQSIDWSLLEGDLRELSSGNERVAPKDWGPTWGADGQQWRAAGSGKVRLMKPSPHGCAIPGCYAFELPPAHAPRFRVFVGTSHALIAERALGRKVADSDIENILDEHLSTNWREIEGYASDADLIISGDDPHGRQVEMLAKALKSYEGKA